MVSAPYYKKMLDSITEEREEPSYFIFGNAVHCRLLEKEKFAKRYFVSKAKAPSNAVQKKFCNMLSMHKKVDEKSIVSAYRLSYSTDKMAEKTLITKANALYTDWQGYISELQQGEGKIILSSTDYDRILAMERNILSNPRAKELLFNNKDVETYNELVIKYEFRGIKMKSKLDRFIINFKDKLITLADVKTHSSRKEDIALDKSFHEVIDVYNYDRQLYVYTVAIYAYLKEKYPDINFNEFKFDHKIITLRSNYSNDIKVFNIDESYLNSGEIKFNNALNRYNYYEKEGYNNDYDTNKFGEQTLKR
jgi:hypothetical protein